VTRTINYVNADGTINPNASVTQTEEYSRNATITNLDSAEPTVTYGDWTLTSNNEIAVSSPVETGYMA
ncbi:mucin-binding protein, partial [Paucilactobacillus suebicus]